MNCVRSGEVTREPDEMFPSVESVVINECTMSTSIGSQVAKKLSPSNIEEAELSLRESSCLNYEEARALLGRIEFQKGNVEAALRVFEGIDIASATTKMKITLSRREERHKRRSKHYADASMSVHAVSLLFESILLKAKALQQLGRFKESAESCKLILDIIESALPEGLHDGVSADCKLQDILTKAVEMLPEVWKQAECTSEAILSYRRALLDHWNLDAEVRVKIQKDFAVYLLYCGSEATPPTLRQQMGSLYVPRNNIEEAVLLLLMLIRKISLKIMKWDPSIIEHLSFALTVSGNLKALANHVEELLPGIIDRKERYHFLALCYYAAGEDLVSLNLLRKLLSSREDPNCVPALLMASSICSEDANLVEEGIIFARRALERLKGGYDDQLESSANCLLGVMLSIHSKSVLSNSLRANTQSEAREVLERALRSSDYQDPKGLYQLSLEHAEQRKLDKAFRYAKLMLKLEGGSNVKSWLLLARILSAQKRFSDAESVVSAALDQTGKWDQGELLRTKAKLQIAQSRVNNAVETYTQILGVIQVQSKSFSYGKMVSKDRKNVVRSFEMDIWHDLAFVYINLSRWRDAENCLSKIEAISSYSAAKCHATGVIYKRKGLYNDALKAFRSALDIDPAHVPSLIATADVLRERDGKSNCVIRSFLMDALQIDRMNASAWRSLGYLHMSEGSSAASLGEAAECFQAAVVLEESQPIEPFR